MFDYTKAAFKKTVSDFKKIDLIRNISTQLIYIAYLIYVICIQSGNLIANVILLSLASAYFLFFLYMKIRGVKRNVKRTVKNVYKWSKQLVKLFNLGVMIYGLSITASHFTAPSLILAALMIVGWVLQILFEVVFQFFLKKAKFIMEGMEADYQKISKPVTSVGNFFKKVMGKEVKEEPTPSKDRVILEEMVSKEKAEKRRQKEEERIEKRSKLSLWWQDKTAVFKRKKAQPLNDDTPVEQIPDPVEEASFSEIFDEEL